VIPRTLVPVELRPVSNGDRPTGKRLSSPLDDRTVVPRDLPIAPIDPKSKIPSHVPLDVLSSRTLVPRGMPVKPLEEIPQIPEYVPLSILDSRTVVPAVVEPPPPEFEEQLEKPPEISPYLREVVEPDLMTTGDLNLLTRSAEERKDARWNAISRIGSIIFHFAVILFLIFGGKIFPEHVPTQAELDLARHQLNFVYLPPAPGERTPPRPPQPRVRITPNILNKVAPKPEITAPPPPPVEKPKPEPELPSAPIPRTPEPEVTQPKPTPAQPVPIPKAPPTPGKLNLAIPNLSPGKSIEQDAEDAMQRNGGPSLRSQAPLPPDGGGGGGGGQGKVGSGLQILSDTQGVDFSSYLQRLLASVQRNWYAIIPESARMGEKGKVFITFKILPDGTVPFPDPVLERTSGKEPLDRAAMSAIRASSPFEPLPSQFHGPFLELRFGFYYNLPIDYQ
jgi:TonB family protein